MNKIIHYALAAMLAAVLPAAQADKPKETQSSVVKPFKPELLKQVQEEDLYGVWGKVMENNDGTLFNMTVIFPDHTAYDMMSLELKQPKHELTITQKVTWSFDPVKQTITQKVTDFTTRNNHEPPKTESEKIGTISTAKVKMLKFNETDAVLEFQEEGNGEKVVYIKQDIRELQKILKNNPNIPK